MTRTIIAAALLMAGLAPALAGEIQYDLKVDGITCPFCVATSEKALRKVEGVKVVSANLETGIIRVCTDGSVKFTDDQLTRVFRKKGFTYRGMSTRATCDAFDDADVLSEAELDRRAAKHAKLGHGGEDMDFSAPHDHDHEN